MSKVNRPARRSTSGRLVSRTLPAMVFLMLGVVLWAGRPGRPLSFSDVRIDLENRTELERITSSELMSGRGAGRYAISVSDPLDFQQGITTKLTRRLPALWTATVPSEMDMHSLQVDYSLLSAGGKWGCLSSLEDARSEIQAQIFPMPPQVTQYTHDFKVIECGVTISLELADAYLAGPYQGTLNVTVYGL